jgi:uncharacterized protein YlaI
MTQANGAPAALQPDDSAAECDYTALLDAIYVDAKPGVYTGPQFDAQAQARAGLWLGERVMHDASHVFGVIVGRACSGDWWVEIDLTGRGVARVLIAADALTLATPELEAVIAAERARNAALMNEGKQRWERANGRKWGSHESRPVRTRTDQPADLGVRRCTTCQRVLAIEQFKFKTRAHDKRSYTCRECENLARRKERARKNPAVFTSARY